MFGFWIPKYLKSHAADLMMLQAPPLKAVERTALDESGPVKPREKGFPFSPSDKLEKDDIMNAEAPYANQAQDAGPGTTSYEAQQGQFANPKFPHGPVHVSRGAW